MNRSPLVLCVLAALSTSALAVEKAPTQLQSLEARIQALEANAETLRQQAAEALAAAQEAKAALEAMKAEQTASAEAATTAEAEAPPPAADAGGANGNAFNPAISIILNGAYAHNSIDPDGYYRSGFPLAGGAGPAAQGLSIAESEVTMYANIDEKFFGQLTLTASNDHGQDSVGVENACIETTSLPNGLGVRAGRFFSDIGYLNSHHAHTDSFYDRPLAYQAFLGGQYGDDGVQLHWLAPAPIYLQFGVEAFAGNNFPSAGGGHGGVGVVTGFVKAGGDINDNTSWLAGLSMLKSTTVAAEDGFSGDNRLYIADGTIKWAPNGNLKDGGLTVRGEYLVDDRNGVYDPPLLLQPGQSAFAQPWIGQRRGGYIEAVYRINRTWELGYRYDKLWADNTGPYASDFDPSRNSVELSWLNSEFALVRLQLSHDLPNPFASDNVLTLQYQVALGAHGAHAF